jgi:hypothetical protein
VVGAGSGPRSCRRRCASASVSPVRGAVVTAAVAMPATLPAMPFVNAYELPTVECLPGWFGRFFHCDSMTFGYWEIAADAVPLHEQHHPE